MPVSPLTISHIRFYAFSSFSSFYMYFLKQINLDWPQSANIVNCPNIVDIDSLETFGIDVKEMLLKTFDWDRLFIVKQIQNFYLVSCMLYWSYHDNVPSSENWLIASRVLLRPREPFVNSQRLKNSRRFLACIGSLSLIVHL